MEYGHKKVDSKVMANTRNEVLDRLTNVEDIAVGDGSVALVGVEEAAEPLDEPRCEMCGGKIGIGGIEDLCADCAEGET